MPIVDKINWNVGSDTFTYYVMPTGPIGCATPLELIGACMRKASEHTRYYNRNIRDDDKRSYANCEIENFDRMNPNYTYAIQTNSVYTPHHDNEWDSIKDYFGDETDNK